VYSNSTFGDGKLKAKLRKTSDLIAKSYGEYKRKRSLPRRKMTFLKCGVPPCDDDKYRKITLKINGF